MESQVLHTVWCNIAGEAAGEIWNWSFLGVKGLNIGSNYSIYKTCLRYYIYYDIIIYYDNMDYRRN